MLIYEKNNKLNINFDNEVSENPDLQIGKDGDKTEVLIDGQPGGGSGGSSPFIVTFSGNDDENTSACDKTWEQIVEAYTSGKQIITRYTEDGYFIYDCNTLYVLDDNVSLVDLEFIIVNCQTSKGVISNIIYTRGSIDNLNEPHVTINFGHIQI